MSIITAIVTAPTGFVLSFVVLFPLLVAGMLGTLRLACSVYVFTPELGRMISVGAADLNGLVDINLAGLIGCIVVTLPALKGTVYVDHTFLDGGVNVCSRRGAAKGNKQCGRKKLNKFSG